MIVSFIILHHVEVHIKQKTAMIIIFFLYLKYDYEILIEINHINAYKMLNAPQWYLNPFFPGWLYRECKDCMQKKHKYDYHIVRKYRNLLLENMMCFY